MEVPDQGVQIRVPATAYLTVDSQDRNNQTFPATSDFQISKNQSILNGFFNRVALSELVLEWRIPNIAQVFGNNTFTVNVGGTDYTSTLDDDFYTVVELMDALVTDLNTLGIPGAPFLYSLIAPGIGWLRKGDAFTVVASPLQNALSIPVGPAPVSVAGIYGPTFTRCDLRPIRYLDFVSSKLTYNQELKDATTNPNTRDVIARWYFAYDNQTDVDADGFAILMGYTPFTLRRQFSPPKQIKWDPRQPVGQLNFEVYADSANDPFLKGDAQYQGDWDYLMSLQVSEN